jgi:hypothetical protein
MAERVMLMSSNETAKPVTGLIGKSLQRKCAHCEEEEKKKKPIMRKTDSGNSDMSVSSSFASSLNASKGGGSSLPQGTRSFMENAFSADFSGIKIHTDSQASEMSKGLNAKAFTYGNDIYFKEGQYNPNFEDGKHLLAHELTHTVQQQGIQRQNIIQKDPDSETGEISVPTLQDTDAVSLAALPATDVEKLISANNNSVVSTELLLCLIWKESGFDPKVKNSGSSATGLMQMTKGAVDQVNKSTPKGVHFTHSEMTNSARNIECGTYYLQIRIDWEKGSIKKGLEGFGTGPGYADKILDCETCIKTTPASRDTCLGHIHH